MAASSVLPIHSGTCRISSTLEMQHIVTACLFYVSGGLAFVACACLEQEVGRINGQSIATLCTCEFLVEVELVYAYSGSDLIQFSYDFWKGVVMG